MRSMASGAAFHRAYPHATQLAFLEAHELAFAWYSLKLGRVGRKERSRLVERPRLSPNDLFFGPCRRKSCNEVGLHCVHKNRGPQVPFRLIPGAAIIRLAWQGKSC